VRPVCLGCRSVSSGIGPVRRGSLTSSQSTRVNRLLDELFEARGDVAPVGNRVTNVSLIVALVRIDEQLLLPYSAVRQDSLTRFNTLLAGIKLGSPLVVVLTVVLNVVRLRAVC
jgi:hypothetical protein